jgi:hypothetical protein
VLDVLLGCDDRGMSSDTKIDYQREAMAAMKMAIAADGFERMKWVRIAQAWHDMGRWVECRDLVTSSPPVVPAEQD